MANISYDHKLFQIIKKPKSKKSIRVLCFGEAVQTELKQLKEREEKERQLLGSEYLKPQTELLTIQQKKVDRIVNACSMEDGNTELSLVCRKHNGGYIQSRLVDVFMKSLSKKVGFRCTSHISRHTHATLLLEEGANIANISSLSTE